MTTQRISETLTLNVAERRYVDTDGDAMDVWWHSFLMLTNAKFQADAPLDEMQGVVQQLHFNRYNGCQMIPMAREGLGGRDRKTKIAVFPYDVGDEKTMLPIWNRALQVATVVRGLGLKFDSDYKSSPTALNCRKGVMLTVEALGYDYDINHAKARAGTGCDAITVQDLNLPEDTMRDMPTPILWAERRRLSQQLPYPKPIAG